MALFDLVPLSDGLRWSLGLLAVVALYNYAAVRRRTRRRQ